MARKKQTETVKDDLKTFKLLTPTNYGKEVKGTLKGDIVTTEEGETFKIFLVKEI